MSQSLHDPAIEPLEPDEELVSADHRPEQERRVTERRSYEDRRRFNYTPPGGRDRRDSEDRRSWVDRREEVRRLFE